MSTYDIAWNRAVTQWRDAPRWSQQAILLQRVALAGKPQLKIVCRIASYDEERIGDVSEREHFWRTARARLGKLYRLEARDIAEIETLLLKRVPRPVPEPQQAAE